jgi:SAM-dependent methyltransferase
VAFGHGSGRQLERLTILYSPFHTVLTAPQPIPPAIQAPEAMPRLLDYNDIAPLDWFQWRCLLWDCLPVELSSSLAPVVEFINSRCADSAPLQQKDIAEALAKLRLHYPECSAMAEPGEGMRIWTRMLYRQVSRLLNGHMPPFLNLGYEGLNLSLGLPDEPFRLFIQLYQKVLRGIPLQGRDVLEIGCGTGGGCDYLHRYHKPASLTGVDLMEDNIALCRARYGPPIRFEASDAGCLGIPSNSRDIVISVESSGHYPSIEKFLGQVKRVLRPRGWFLLADLRPAGSQWGEGRGIEDLLRDCKSAGFAVVDAENISAGIVRSIEVQEEGRREFLDGIASSGNIRAHLREILLTCDSANFRMLCQGSLQYWSLACQE